jgi:hypothetical protein
MANKPILVRWGLTLIAGLGLWSLVAAREPGEADEQMLRNAGVQTDTPGLLAYLRANTLSPARQQQIESLIRQLGDPSFKVRAKASSELTALGTTAKPFLLQAVKSSDLEVSRRAEGCLRQINERGRTGIAEAAARLIASRKPAGATEVLLGYLPFAENDGAAEEIQNALQAVAVRDGKPEKELIAALGDKVAVRRAAAAEILLRAGLASYRPQVRKLLQDSDLSVRLRAALVLAGAKERDAIPVLIELLTELPAQRAWQAEDVLLRLAGEQAPAATLGRDDAVRRKCRDAWAAWWDAHAATADLSRIEGSRRLLGYTLLVLLDAGRAIELDANDQPRLEFDGLQKPLDAQMLPGDRLLVAEHDGNRVTERNRKGEIIWEKRVDQPLMAQRLPNGHTFIATTNQLLEVDRDGTPLFALGGPRGESIMKALKLPNGDIACVTMMRRFVRMDPGGQELFSFGVNVSTSGGRIEVLPSGRVLVPEMNFNRVVEYDNKGEVVWMATARQPVAAVRLANGHTLVTGMMQTRAVELDRAGAEFWSYDVHARVTRAFRR